MLRSCWTATGIARQVYAHSQEFELSQGAIRPNYNSYIRRLVGLLNLTRQALPDATWINLRRGAKEKFEDEAGMLYLDELSWLYNELGLAAFCQGSLDDAYSLFRNGEHVNELADCDNAGGDRVAESHLNIAIVEIESGRLARAQFHIDRVLSEAAGRFKSEAFGYAGLLHHLSGNYSLAENCYEECLDRLAFENQNLRAQCIFLKHKGDLLRTLVRNPMLNR